MDQQELFRPKKPFIVDDEIMELGWQNGPVVTQTQNHRHINEPLLGRNSDDSTRGGTSLPREHQFMQEGEMASVLHYANGTMQGTQMRSEQVPPNFAYLARRGVRAEPEPLSAGESIVDFCDTVVSMAVTETAEGETSLTPPLTTFDETDGWSSDLTDGGSSDLTDDGWSSDGEMGEDEWKYPNERHRDQINEKLKALQQLIPPSNKSDEESILDEVIEYTKSLQLQSIQLMQMMSTECGMVPMMFPGIQQYMPPIGMGINMFVMSFSNMFPSSALPANFGPRFSMPPFYTPHIPTPNSFTMPATNVADNNMPTSVGTHDSNNPESGNGPNKCQQVRKWRPVR